MIFKNQVLQLSSFHITSLEPTFPIYDMRLLCFLKCPSHPQLVSCYFNLLYGSFHKDVFIHQKFSLQLFHYFTLVFYHNNGRLQNNYAQHMQYINNKKITKFHGGPLNPCYTKELKLLPFLQAYSFPPYLIVIEAHFFLPSHSEENLTTSFP